MNLSAQIRETFRKAALQRAAAQGLRGDDWARYREIESAYEQKAAQEQTTYRDEYEVRVETTRRKLVDHAAAKGRPFLPRFLGVDRFNKADIDRQAHRIVQLDHEMTLNRLEEARQSDIEALLTAAEDRGTLARKVQRDFASATDRRSGPDRRKGPSR